MSRAQLVAMHAEMGGAGRQAYRGDTDRPKLSSLLEGGPVALALDLRQEGGGGRRGGEGWGAVGL